MGATTAAERDPDPRNARVLVAGLGASGLAAARALARAGASVRAIDAASSPHARRAAEELGPLGVDVHLGVGFEDPALLGDAELVVASPGIPEHNPLLASALAEGRPVWSEPELAWRLAGGRSRLVAVTGTNGKTTTTELLGTLLAAPTGGNIGTPLVDLLAAAEPPEVVAVELSSFQLRFCSTLRPDVAVLLNIAPDHLDWHPDVAAYTAAKAQLWAEQGSGDVLVLGDDEGAREACAAHPPAGRLVTSGIGPPEPGGVGIEDGLLVARVGRAGEPAEATEILPVGHLALRGPHNLANAAAAVGAAVAAGADPGELAEPLAAYQPGAHRLTLVTERAGIAWIDDSKATNPHAAAAALASRGEGRRIVWIGGGLAKGLDLTVLEPTVARYVKHALAIGASAAEIVSVAGTVGVPVEHTGTVEAAVARAAAIAEPGDTVLLAPACASMDQFADYAARGDAFAAAVHTLDGRDAEVGRE
ncbi:UDP-N-acetylmuramoyl-L-alanine--D-glutamate ligase [Egibacter rhizosphaerae]|uniref:UDP-N-acetylmuramoylalanine--D-glutamate ligase n=1 Tax=Egibacter rhizosphaerae TaxID=1670831 RepID=A0A411YA90_9ACTN|nr:UDP-N-acetylmuramoyl-L-alanine--D-glutamate ligase [Egibacter rhizosphaerae]QBI18133.1 UDP-N-acetylmuramoyl-L-alanine--D-glutamate ligase [Egibacter rhizosphaerae]